MSYGDNPRGDFEISNRSGINLLLCKSCDNYCERVPMYDLWECPVCHSIMTGPEVYDEYGVTKIMEGRGRTDTRFAYRQCHHKCDW